MNNTKVISGNSKVVRSINRAMILNIIREQQPISRVKISRLTGLNKSTVSSIVTDLLSEDMVFEDLKSREDQNVGRNPVDLYLKLGTHLVGAINIDSSVTRFAIADINGSILKTSSITTNPEKPQKFIERCLNEIKSLSNSLNIKSLEGLGLSIAGIVDSKNLKVNFAPNLGWEDFNIGQVIKNNLPNVRTVAIENDAKCSALAELWYGKHTVDLSNFVFLSIGPGIGSGIVVGNQILDGEFHAAGEFGHMSLYENGIDCRCGNRGCWEAYASDIATINRYISKSGTKISRTVDSMFKYIFKQAYEYNETAAIETLKETGYYLGVGIANIIKAIDPHVIIIGGKITQAWDIIHPQIMEAVMSRAFFKKENDIHILPSSLEARPRLLGAATLAIKEIFDDYKIIN